MYIQQIPWQPNYAEDELPPWQLPNPLLSVKNEPIDTIAQWEENREALLETFRRYMYGKRLPLPDQVRYTLLSEKKGVVDGKADMRQIELEFSMNNGKKRRVVMLLFTPAAPRGPVPVFAGLTFHGNHVVYRDPEILITGLPGKDLPFYETGRGIQEHRFPVRELMERNFALAVCSYHDFFPDSALYWKESILSLFLPDEAFAERPAEYSAIGAWAWGLSRMLDCLQTLPWIDGENAAVFGHSRLGKTALWAGVEDPRFKLLCVNDSGCGGAAPSRRLYGETLFAMCSRSETGYGNYWFVRKTADHAAAPETLPVDQHQLIALAAPRAIAVHSATEDQWADPRGEYLSLYHAGPVYALYGKEILSSAEPPPPDTPVGTHMSYFLRTGKHELLLSDWNCYMDAFDRVLRS